MDSIQPLELKKRIDQRRKEFSFLPSYMGPWALLGRCQLEQRKGNQDPAFSSFCEDLQEYARFGLSFVHEQASIRDAGEAPFIETFCLDAMKDPSFEEHASLLEDLLAYYGDGEDFLPRDGIVLLLDIVLGYRRGPYPWRGKKYARELFRLLDDEPYPREFWQTLADFYKSVLDYRSASDVALEGSAILLKNKKKKDAALLCRDGLASALALPHFRFPEEARIREFYEEEADVALSYPRYATFKHDPIEASPEFQNAYDEVMEEATKRYLKEKEGRVILLLWSYMAEGFAKRGIAWKTPKQMNPSMKFD